MRGGARSLLHKRACSDQCLSTRRDWPPAAAPRPKGLALSAALQLPRFAEGAEPPSLDISTTHSAAPAAPQPRGSASSLGSHNRRRAPRKDTLCISALHLHSPLCVNSAAAILRVLFARWAFRIVATGGGGPPPPPPPPNPAESKWLTVAKAGAPSVAHRSTIRAETIARLLRSRDLPVPPESPHALASRKSPAQRQLGTPASHQLPPSPPQSFVFQPRRQCLRRHRLGLRTAALASAVS